MASLIGHERRALWAALSILLAGALVTSLLITSRTRDGLVDEAVQNVEKTAQSALSPLLKPKDLRAPITGLRRAQVSEGIREITTAGPVNGVTIWSASGRILYDEEQALQGNRISSIRDLLSEAAAGATQSRVVSNTLEVYTAVRARSGGPVAVAQLDQPYGPVVADARSPVALLLGLCLALLAALALLVSSLRKQPKPEQVVYVPPRPRMKPSTEEPDRAIASTVATPSAVSAASAVHRPSTAPAPSAAPSAAASDGGNAALEKALRTAEARARTADENYWGLQAQYKLALEQIAQLEAQVQVHDATSSQADEELKALREQARESTEQMEAAEVDNKALRERLTLQRTQLDESETQMRAAQQRIERLEKELADIRMEGEQQRYRVHAAGLEVLRQLNEADSSPAQDTESEEVVVEANERAPRVIIGMPSTAPVFPAGPPPASPPDAEQKAYPNA
ncbi:MAG: hypothetical protein AB1551_02485 [Actinomycetota bacterium]